MNIALGNHTVEMIDEFAPFYLMSFIENNEHDLNFSSKVNIGDVYEPYDNSWSINVETGEKAHPLYCYWSDKNEYGTIYTVVSKPYIDHVQIYLGEPEITVITRLFVNVKSSKTGNIYRVLLK